ncbi:hypothetical protein DSO57_1012047 [Entomophthora muscae]|uniref:Uncharacterized protein n=1 Tax=Entomophthora muscae TaxID=34485 RepID=A0ACC2RKV5_9FUNG|nr:hypothetical protein DSO57_1012047 [Entomophthora muscae]
MHPVVGLLCYIPYNLILGCIITGRWGPSLGLLLVPPNVTSMPFNLGVFPAEFESETVVTSQCPGFYAEDMLILSQATYLGLLWLDSGGYFPSHGDLFLLSVYFCHKEPPTIDLMSLMSILVTNHNTSPEESMDQSDALENITPEQKGCATLPEDPVNEHISCASAILLPQNLGVLPTQILIS